MWLRVLTLALAAAAVGATSRIGAQQRPTPQPLPPGQPNAGGAITLGPETQPGRRPVPPQVRSELAILRATRLAGSIPPADSFIMGGRRVAPGETVRGTVAVARGPIDVFGRVEGDAIALHGDVVVHEGGVIRGSAVAIGGRVRARGGVVEGSIRSVHSLLPAGRSGMREVPGPDATWRAIKVVLGWLAILVVLGIGVLVFAEPTFDPIVEALRLRFARAFCYGLVAQLAAIPALLVIVLGLALTVVGILLIPFAIVAYAVALTGVLALGFLAVARFTGGAIARGPRAGASQRVRGTSLRALVIGLVTYMGLWLAAAAFTWSPLAGSILRAAALAVTWVAVTLGLGALVVSRVARRAQSGVGPGVGAADPMVWQTPTPVTGVAAARRPAATARSEV